MLPINAQGHSLLYAITPEQAFKLETRPRVRSCAMFRSPVNLTPTADVRTAPLAVLLSLLGNKKVYVFHNTF